MAYLIFTLWKITLFFSFAQISTLGTFTTFFNLWIQGYNLYIFQIFFNPPLNNSQKSKLKGFEQKNLFGGPQRPPEDACSWSPPRGLPTSLLPVANRVNISRCSYMSQHVLMKSWYDLGIHTNFWYDNVQIFHDISKQVQEKFETLLVTLRIFSKQVRTLASIYILVLETSKYFNMGPKSFQVLSK